MNALIPNRGDDMEKQVKKETVLVIALICLVIGFLGGIVFSVYKSPSTPPAQVAAPAGAPPQQAQQAQLKQEQASQILSLEREVASNPQNADAWVQLGHLYFDTDQAQKAISAYNKFLAINPDNADVLTDLGVMYRRNGQIKEALEAFDRAVTVDNSHEQSRFNKAIVLLYDLKDAEGAIKSWEELLAINPLAAGPNGMPVKDIIEDVRSKAAATAN